MATMASLVLESKNLTVSDNASIEWHGMHAIHLNKLSEMARTQITIRQMALQAQSCTGK